MTAIGMKENEYVPVRLAIHIDSDKPHRYMAVINEDYAGWGDTPAEAIEDAADRMKQREAVPA